MIGCADRADGRSQQVGVVPVGSYRREFDLPKTWDGRQVLIHFDGVSAAFYLWVNGKKVGYSQDSRTPAEWNITAHLKPGRTLIGAQRVLETLLPKVTAEDKRNKRRNQASRRPRNYFQETMSDFILQMTGITKSFGGIRALDGVDFNVAAGEVHALIGENGAGKSTLMNVLAGRFADYDGQITFHSQVVRFTSPRQVLGLGIGVIFQELSVLPNLTVAENIMLGSEPRGGLPGSMDRASIRRAAQKTLDYLQFDLPIDEEVANLSAARQCLVEIARAIHRDVRLLVFDEPTASLGNEDVRKLFDVIRDLKKRGLGMVYISHRLAELPQIAERVTVLRDGKVVGSRPMADCKPSDLSRMMLGRDLTEMFPKRTPKPGATLLKVSNLNRPGVFKNISFDLKAGEILGIAGLVGSGRTEIARAIVGADRATGRCELDGKPVVRRPDRCKQQGICLVPEDRKRDGNITGRPIQENINAGILDRLSGPLGFLAPTRLRSGAENMIAQMEVHPALPAMEIQKLSGGNQQKVIIGRTLSVNPRVIIFDEPTQGIDVGTKAQIYKLIARLAAEGRGILLISSEFIELTELADRILVIRDGEFAGEFKGEHMDEESLFAACMGIHA